MTLKKNAARVAVAAEPCRKVHPCDYMGLLVHHIYDTLLKAGDDVPPMRKLSISKLAILMRAEITSAKEEAPIAKAQQDARFQKLKAKLVKKPRKNSRLWKEVS